MAGQITFGDLGDQSPIKVSINQFHGIEINDFAVTVGKTALWIAESQMMQETEDIVHMNLDFLPLKTNATIIEGNALRIDWNDVCPAAELNYIMGNPPFVAKTGRTAANEAHSVGILSDSQKADRFSFFGKDGGILDYVCCWYKKASLFSKGTTIRTALVSTSSICQGQQVYPLWKSLLEDGISINFAYRSFKWESEASSGATVYVVIVGFSHVPTSKCTLYSGSIIKNVSHISPYLLETDDIFICTRNRPISNVPFIAMGNQPIDDGNYLFKPEEKEQFLKTEPQAEPYFHLWFDAAGFINGRQKYCLWLGDCTPNELKKMPECLKRIEAVKIFRSASKRKSTIKLADKPTRFQTENMPKGSYIAIPEVSSGNRRYIPMGFLDGSILCSNKLRLMPQATLYHFGILNSNVHMAWMRAVGGYFGPSFQYSINIVYNNFPWPETTKNQKGVVEQTAQGILDARALYPDSSLADLYDPLTMPPELITAHQKNDMAVMRLYGFQKTDEDGKKHWFTEEECVAALMKMYQQKVAELNSK